MYLQVSLKTALLAITGFYFWRGEERRLLISQNLGTKLVSMLQPAGSHGRGLQCQVATLKKDLHTYLPKLAKVTEILKKITLRSQDP